MKTFLLCAAALCGWGFAIGLALFVLAGCGGGEDEAPTVAEEVPKYHVPATPDPCTVTFPCEKK